MFELLVEGKQILDVGFTDDGVIEIALNPIEKGVVMDLDNFLALLDEGKSLADRDR